MGRIATPQTGHYINLQASLHFSVNANPKDPATGIHLMCSVHLNSMAKTARSLSLLQYFALSCTKWQTWQEDKRIWIGSWTSGLFWLFTDEFRFSIQLAAEVWRFWNQSNRDKKTSPSTIVWAVVHHGEKNNLTYCPIMDIYWSPMLGWNSPTHRQTLRWCDRRQLYSYERQDPTSSKQDG